MEDHSVERHVVIFSTLFFRPVFAKKSEKLSIFEFTVFFGFLTSVFLLSSTACAVSRVRYCHKGCFTLTSLFWVSKFEWFSKNSFFLTFQRKRRFCQFLGFPDSRCACFHLANWYPYSTFTIWIVLVIYVTDIFCRSFESWISLYKKMKLGGVIRQNNSLACTIVNHKVIWVYATIQSTLGCRNFSPRTINRKILEELNVFRQSP